jgi:NAD(P)H-dependent FMN reductase
MKFAIVSGSHRPNSQSLKVARFIESVLPREIPGASSWLFDLGGNPLPLWSEEDGGAPDALWRPIAAELQSADGLIIISPEWSGMVPAGLKNFLLCCSTKEVGHKPGLIVTVSASRGGAYPVSELRMSGYKNNRLCWIPEHVIVRDVGDALNDANAEPADRADAYLRQRLGYALRVLASYAQALQSVRSSGAIDHEQFPNGM